MEVWALEAYAAANILQEMITIKSDDVAGRTQAYEAIVKNSTIKKPNIPESFNVLIKELQAINLDVTLLDKHELKEKEEDSAARFDEILEIEAKVMLGKKAEQEDAAKPKTEAKAKAEVKQETEEVAEKTPENVDEDDASEAQA